MAPVGFNSRGTDLRTHSIDAYFYNSEDMAYGRKRKRTYKHPFKPLKIARKSSYNQRKYTGSKYANGAPTTFQSQYATDYTKKKVSKYRRRVAKRVYRQFKKNLFKQVGCQHIVFRHQARATAAENSQEWIDIPLYSAYGGLLEDIPAEGRFQHMEQMADDMVASTGNQVTEQYGILRSTYGQLDLQMTNRSAHTIHVNVYYYTCKRDCARLDCQTDDVTLGFQDTPIGLLDQVQSLQFPSQAGSTNVRSTRIGFTPFQSPRYCRFFTIVKKQRFQMAAGQSITDMLKDKRIREWSRNAVTTFTAKKGFTTGMLINFHGMYDGSGSPSDFPQSVVDWSAQYTYNCKLLERRVDTAVYNSTVL